VKFLFKSFLISISLITPSVYAEKFHCRITDVTDYETKEKVSDFFLNEEFLFESAGETDIFHHGEVDYLSSYEGALNLGTGKREKPFIVISKLDGKFFDMFLYSKQYKYYLPKGASVAGFCKER